MAAIEFMLAAVPLLLAGLGAFELARWHLVRQTVSYALLEAARAGSVHNGAPDAMQAALERALLPLHGGGRNDEERARSLARMQRAATAFEARHGLPPWRITVLSPTTADFAQHADTALRLPLAGGRRTINNAYQEEQHARAAQGGRTIFDANTLVLRLTYLHQPLVPGLRGLLRQLGSGNSYGARAMTAAGVVPMSRDITVVMQSHPVQWGPDSSPLARTVWGETTFDGNTPAPPACTGFWCQNTPPAPGTGGGPNPTPPTTPTTPPEQPGTPPTGPQDPGTQPNPGTPDPSRPDPNTPSPPPDTGPNDPGAGSDACGVTLCCPAP